MKNERGIALVIALLTMTLLMVLGLAALTMSLTEKQVSTNHVRHAKTFWYAEGALEEGYLRTRNLLLQNPKPTASELAVIAVGQPVEANYTISTFQVTDVAEPSLITINFGAYKGLNAVPDSFEVFAEATGPAGVSRVSRNADLLDIPLFQFGVYYGKGVDLEIAPGPSMTFNGRVHSNSNIYIKGNSANFDSWMTTTGNLYRYLKRDPSDRGSNPQIKDAAGNYQTLDFDHEYDQGFGSAWTEAEWRDAANSTFGGRVQDSAMGVEEILPPIPDVLYDPNDPTGSTHVMIEEGVPGDSPELQEAKLYYKADMIITNPGAAKDQSGTPIPIPGVITTETFYDGREAANVQVLEIDVAALIASGNAPANGVLYVKNTGANKGVRLVNGTELPAGGLTIVSENPVYVQGDYNTVNKKPAAVLADAITVLSNNWEANGSDAKGDLSTSDRPATPTTVNAAFALGPNTESGVGAGNGQLENLIRFLEDWNGQSFTYSGSLVAMWHSQQASSDWRCCGDGAGQYYNAPDRVWSFDTDLSTTTPPGAPTGKIIVRGTWRVR